MPQLMTLFGYKVYFWSNENNPLEPIHVHISKHPHKNATNDFSDEIIQKWQEHFINAAGQEAPTS